MKFSPVPLLFGSFMFLFSIGCQDTNDAKNDIETAETLELEANSSPSSLEIGQNIANQAQLTLGKNLMQAINTGGTEHAIPFCSEKAIYLTDSVGVSFHATVKRVSDKNRNPKNAANEDQLAYIRSAKVQLAKGEMPKGVIKTAGNREIGYYPIVSNQLCMQCHGKPDTDITSETLSKINSLYPKDLATGYSPNELRGIWVVEMDQK